MKVIFVLRYKAILAGWLCVLLLSTSALPQKKTPASNGSGSASARPAGPVVKQIDELALQKLLKPNGKPLLINFWATWCDPCREEFPDLVKIDNEFKGKIDFITVSLDDLADISAAVPKFLSSMKAEMPAYLLKTADESAAILSVAKDWQGGMPFTILFNEKGERAYFRQGKVNVETVRAEIGKLIAAPVAAADELHVTIDFVKIKDGKRDETMFYYETNWKRYREEALKRGVIHSYELLDSIPATTAPFD